MSEHTDGVPLDDLRDGRVRRVDGYAVGVSKGEPFAVGRVCRHQLADLSRGTVDAQGCLVCPWHGARYDVTDGRMVEGPKGFAWYHGPARGYRAVVKAYARFLPLRRHATRTVGGRVELD